MRNSYRAVEVWTTLAGRKKAGITTNMKPEHVKSERNTYGELKMHVR